MNANKYSTWKPTADIVGRVIVDKIEDSDKGLVIYFHLRNIDRKYRVVFDAYVAYRNMDESYRARTFYEHGGFENSFNLVEHSSWLEWLHTESQGYYRGADLKHYSIITDADCIDVLSEFEPIIESLD